MRTNLILAFFDLQVSVDEQKHETGEANLNDLTLLEHMGDHLTLEELEEAHRMYAFYFLGLNGTFTDDIE